MRREKTVKSVYYGQTTSKDPTPNKKDTSINTNNPMGKISKDINQRIMQALFKIEQRLNSFLVENFEVVLESTYDSSKYSKRVSGLLEQFKHINVEVMNSIFKKLANAIQPLVLFPQKNSSNNNSKEKGGNRPSSRAKKNQHNISTHRINRNSSAKNQDLELEQAMNESTQKDSMIRTIKILEKELSIRQQQLIESAEQNHKLRSTIRIQAERVEEDRQKQNRMTELLYILRKKNIDIDRIYEQNCETPMASQRFSVDSQNVDHNR